jgi:PAS domain S-box-containing protein
VKKALRILFIEDNTADAELVSAHLENENIAVLSRIETAGQLQEALQSQTWDVILADYALPNFDALAALKILQTTSLDIPFIVVARTVGETRAIEMMKAGASDFVLKSDLSRLVPCIRREILECANRAARKQAEGRLRHREVQLSAVLENAYDGIVTTETQGRILEFNRAAERIFGITRSEALGTSLWQWIDPKKAWRQKNETLLKPLTELSLSLPDGSQVHLELSMVRISVTDQEVLTYFIRDVTESKNQKIELEQAKNLAENANRAKSNFLANMSHEIRTPLGAILGFAELMADPEQPAQERLEYIEIIKRNGDQLSRVISEILDLSKVESDRLQIERIQFSLPELLKDVTTLLKLQAEEKNLILGLKFDRDLPPHIVSDPTRLRQILINIVGNAIKFTERGEITLSASPVKADGKIPACIRFSITDTGLGISPDQVENLFEPFMQADSSMTRRFGGTGLGLALSRRLAKALGGDLNLQESTAGHGSTFVFTIESGLTAHQQKENGIHPDFIKALDSVRPKDKLSGPDLTGTSILVVDDSPDNCSLISYILTRAGAKVDTKTDGRSGCEQALKANYDLVFMDIQMPKMDGYEAAAHLLSKNYSKPLVAITAHAMKGDRERCLSSGFQDHLTKPIDRALLLNIASRLIDLETKETVNADIESYPSAEI